MSWQFNRIEGEILEFVIAGSFDSEASQAAGREVQPLLQQGWAQAFLIDCQHMTGGLSAVDIYDIAQIWIAAGVPRVARIATVLPITRERLPNYRFFETVVTNRGFNMRLFEDRETALAWLRKALAKTEP